MKIRKGVMLNMSDKKESFNSRLSGQLKERIFEWSASERSIGRFKLSLYRFLRDNIPILGSCIWTWSRLASAPGKYDIVGSESESYKRKALDCLKEMSLRIYPFQYQKTAGFESFLPMLFNTLFTDGAFAGVVLVDHRNGGIDRFQPIETGDMTVKKGRDGKSELFLNSGDKSMKIDSSDFYYFGLDADSGNGLGQSIFKSISFVAYIQQQLIDDMQKSMHNAGYHRLHVQISPPERQSGEADTAYVERVNGYFDDTVSMIKDCGPEENPVTWDNVKIEYIGPRNVTGVGNSWFMNHRTMVEEICAGTNLSPFMLGYSYGTTHNWAQFKYDLVMRQILSVQRQTSRFLEWLGDIELALKGYNCRCRYQFDNSFSYNASDLANIRKTDVDNLLKLYDAGLIDKDQAVSRAGGLI